MPVSLLYLYSKIEKYGLDLKLQFGQGQGDKSGLGHIFVVFF